MRHIFQTAILLLGMFGLLSGQSMAEKRVALVIGNSNYTNAPQLTNPKNDANAISAALENLGFEVIKGLDLDERQTLKTLNKFRRKVITADVALLFYAGHGLQVGGDNYLVPTNATLESELDLQAQAMRLETILGMMENPNRTSIILLDACRDNPLARRLSRSLGTRSNSVGRGLARVETGLGTYIGFSTEPGSVALDGEGLHSPFAQALLNNIQRENQDIESIMRLVRAEVFEKTNGDQIPWGNSSLIGKGFVFNKSIVKNEIAATAELLELAEPVQSRINFPKQSNTPGEIAYWNTIKDAKSKIYFQSYLDQFPGGLFVPLANMKISEFENAKIIQTKTANLDKPVRKSEPIPVVDSTTNNENMRLAKLETENEIKENQESQKSEVTKGTIRSIQKELNRLGCNAGKADGIWGKGSRNALRQFDSHAGSKFAAIELSGEILDLLRAKKTRICPLNCRSGFEKKNDRCVRVKRKASIDKKPRKVSPPKPKSKSNRSKNRNTKVKKNKKRIDCKQIAKTCGDESTCRKYLGVCGMHNLVVPM